MTRSRSLLVAAFMALAAGCMRPPPIEGAPCPCPSGFRCVGVCIPLPDGDPPDLTPQAPNNPPVASCVDLRSPPPARRLRADEYSNTVRDLLGLTVVESLPADPAPGKDDPAAIVPEAYVTLAQTLALRAVAQNNNLLPCDPATTGPTSCGQTFIDTFAPRAWRRPITGDERAALRSTFATALPLGFDKAIAATIASVLAGKSFVFRLESGNVATRTLHAIPLTPWEIASRLSYLLWRSMPDEPLSAAAQSGALDTAAGVRAQAERLLNDARAGQMLAAFQRHWLRLDDGPDDAAPTSLVSPELRASIARAADETVNQLLNDGSTGDGDLRTLLTWPMVLGDSAMASFYDLRKPVGGGMEMLSPLGDQQRFGILTTPAFLSTHGHADQSAPVIRGIVIRESLLCLAAPGPPSGAAFPLNSPIVTATTRQRYAEHSNNPSCAVCHATFDPIGFGLENYDGYGRWRDTDNGHTVDANGAVEGKGFDGPGGMAALFASDPQISRDVSTCLVTQWFRYAFERPEGVMKEDQCTLDAIHGDFASGGFKVRALLLSLATSGAFLTLPAGH